ncbi:MAG: hypothetical protein WC703_07365 [Candidatus Neomarinimicrobiota bacterium]
MTIRSTLKRLAPTSISQQISQAGYVEGFSSAAVVQTLSCPLRSQRVVITRAFVRKPDIILTDDSRTFLFDAMNIFARNAWTLHEIVQTNRSYLRRRES